MKLLESKKRDYHRIVDIGHMLSMEIKETKQEVENSKELHMDQVAKQARLLEKNKDRDLGLEKELDILNLLDKEVLKAKQEQKSKEDELFTLMLEEKRLTAKLDGAQEQLEKTKSERNMTQVCNDQTQKDIVLKEESSSKQTIEAGRKTSACVQLEDELQALESKKKQLEEAIKSQSTDESSQIKELNQHDYDQILLQKQVDDQSRYVKILKQ